MTRVSTTHAQVISAALAAGAIGGVVNALIAPLFGFLHLTKIVGVDIGSDFTKADLYAKVFWGAVWGLLFLLPWKRITNWWVRAIVIGLVPSLVQIFLVFPLHDHISIGGVNFGALTPVFVVIFNTLGWSLPAAAWFTIAGFWEDPHGHIRGAGGADEGLLA